MRLQREGRLVPGGLENAQTDRAEPLADALGEEPVALFVPQDDLKALTGSYQHLRAAAHIIGRSLLRAQLPAAWQDMHASDLMGADGKPFRDLPRALRTNMAFTKVSFLDPNVEAKVFVRQHPYGTGSLFSTLDSITDRTAWRHNRFWSLDGEFLDDVDPQWMFWQRETEYKHRLYKDYMGHRSAAESTADGGADPCTGRHGGFSRPDAALC